MSKRKTKRELELEAEVKRLQKKVSSLTDLCFELSDELDSILCPHEIFDFVPSDEWFKAECRESENNEN